MLPVNAERSRDYTFEMNSNAMLANKGFVGAVIDQCLFICASHTACIIMAVLYILACDKLMNLIKLKLVLPRIYDRFY